VLAMNKNRGACSGMPKKPMDGARAASAKVPSGSNSRSGPLRGARCLGAGWTGSESCPQVLLRKPGSQRQNGILCRLLNWGHAQLGVAGLNVASDSARSVAGELEFLGFAAIVADRAEDVAAFGFEEFKISDWVVVG
jgi:hypothetical protein